MPSIVHFEIYADEVLRATKFYSEVFGWQMHKWDGPEEYWLAIPGGASAPVPNWTLSGRQLCAARESNRAQHESSRVPA